MKKLIFILGSLLILTGCSDYERSRIGLGHINSVPNDQAQGVYINEDMKELVYEINNLRIKHKEYLDDIGYDPLYIDIYDNHHGGLNHISFDNQMISHEEYFNDIVEVLDGNIAEGLKDFVDKIKDGKIDVADSINKKIGDTVVFADKRMDEELYISIKVNILDMKDENRREIFDRISDGNYILQDLISGDKLDVLDFVNPERVSNSYHAKEVKVRYNVFLHDKDIEKINILLEGKKGVEIEDKDIDVFINLLNSLDLSEEEKDLLVEEYKSIFASVKGSKKISLDKYDLHTNTSKGNSYSGDTWELRYFSIEKR